jgi:predicted acylesterase/phospholipase RssA
LSGGGSNGAFGAGILNGCSAAGTRPTFKIVTGISTGALIAPLVFLGEDYDHVLKQVYTSVETKDIIKLVFIPTTYELHGPLNFDPLSMERLFDLGYRMALLGDPWQNHPPGYK